MYNFIYRLEAAGSGWDVSSPLNIDNTKDVFERNNVIAMTDEEAIEQARERLESDKGVTAWMVTKRWFPKDGGNAVKCEIIAQSEARSSRLDVPYPVFSKID